MTRKRFSILFYIKKTKLLKSGEAPIYMRITIDGERSETSVLRSIKTDYWDSAKGRAKPVNKNNKDLNYYLEHVRHQVYLRQQEMEEKGKIITARTLRNAYLKKDDEEKKTVLQFYTEHNDKLKLMVGKGIAYNTYKRHSSSKRHLKRFLSAKYKMSDFYLKDITPEFLENYVTYFRVGRGCNNNTTVKYVRNLAKIIRLAMKKDLITTNPLRDLELKVVEVDKPFLNQDELSALQEKELPIDRIAQVRDVFVFCCYTGLAYVDTYSLKYDDIINDSKGLKWLKIKRHKTGLWAHIPLLPPAENIINRYRQHPRCAQTGLVLPVLSNQRMNAYLKEVADLCGIKKNLTTHCARHTFATTVTLANNVSMESVSKMLGHSSLRITKQYARILDSSIAKEMRQVAKKYM